MAKGDHVYLIDGSGYIFRAYHALPPLTRPSDGLPVGAVHGFCAMLWKLLRETRRAVAADPFRGDLRPFRARPSATSSTTDYKAHRPDVAGGPRPAIPADPRRGARPSTSPASSRKATRPTTSSPPMRAQALEAGADVTIVSSDKDLMQLVAPGRRACTTP